MLFLDVVVSSSHSDDDANCNVDGHAFNPTSFPTVLDDTNNEGNSSGNQKDLEDPVLEVLEDQLQQSSDLGWSLVILSVPNSRNKYNKYNYFFSLDLISLASPSIPVYLG